VARRLAQRAKRKSAELLRIKEEEAAAAAAEERRTSAAKMWGAQGLFPLSDKKSLTSAALMIQKHWRQKHAYHAYKIRKEALSLGDEHRSKLVRAKQAHGEAVARRVASRKRKKEELAKVRAVQDADPNHLTFKERVRGLENKVAGLIVALENTQTLLSTNEENAARAAEEALVGFGRERRKLQKALDLTRRELLQQRDCAERARGGGAEANTLRIKLREAMERAAAEAERVAGAQKKVDEAAAKEAGDVDSAWRAQVAALREEVCVWKAAGEESGKLLGGAEDRMRGLARNEAAFEVQRAKVCGEQMDE
jgi:hypothetical protein